MATAVKLASEMNDLFSRNFYNVEVATEMEKQLEKVADMYLENFFKEKNV